MRVFGIICIVLGSLSFLGALIGGHSVFGPVFWLALGIALVIIANQKKDNNRRVDKQPSINGKQHSASNVPPLPNKNVPPLPNKVDNTRINAVVKVPTTVKTNIPVPMTTKQKEAAICLISYFGGYNDDIETNLETNQIVYSLSYQASIYFEIQNFPEMLPGAMQRNSDPDKMIDTVMTIVDRQYKEFLLLSCYDLTKMSGKAEAYDLLYNIANEMGYNSDRFNSLIKQYSRN